MPRYRYSVVSAQIDKAERNNIALWSHSGSLNVDIWLMPKERVSYAKIKLGAKGRITARLVGILIYFLPQQPS
jgi:hypothetical protein